MGILAGVDILTLPEKLFLKVKKITLQIITILTTAHKVIYIILLQGL